MSFRIIEKRFGDSVYQNVSAFLPKLPFTQQEYFIGIENEKREQKRLFKPDSSSLAIDTLLPIPPAGYFYYISCGFISDNNKFSQVFEETFHP